jgi:hypothetical protein
MPKQAWAHQGWPREIHCASIGWSDQECGPLSGPDLCVCNEFSGYGTIPEPTRVTAPELRPGSPKLRPRSASGNP